MAAGTQGLTALLKRATIEDHEEVLKACNTALRQSNGDVETQYVKIIALLKLDRFDDAIRVFEEGGERLKQKGQLERAYALYKLGKLEDAQGLAKEISDNRGAKHVEAQASYRLEKFPAAAGLYKFLSESKEAAIENEENDLRINSGAVAAQLEWKREGHLVQKKKVEREDLEAFETAYNAACGCIARGELGQGQILLQRAKDLCISADYLTDQQKTEELLPISVQQLYVLGTLEKTEQGEELASKIALAEITDLSTRQVAQMNMLATPSKASNPYLCHRIITSILSLPESDQLFEFQKTLKRQNELALDLLASKFTGVADSTAKFLAENAPSTTSTSVNSISSANAAAHAQNQLGKLGLKSILPLLEKRPKDVGLIVTIIQLYILTNNHGSAITVMESFLKRLDESTEANDQDVRFAPGLVAVLVSLYSKAGRKLHIRRELAKAAAHWRHRSKSSPSLMRAAGISLLDSSKSSDLDLAKEIFNDLHQKYPSDRFAIAGYVAAHAIDDPSKVEKLAEKLTTVNRLTAGVDVAALENAGVAQTKPVASVTISKKRAAEDITKPMKKRVRKARLPKDYDPSKAPDPERWLPLRDRSSYKPKGKKGKQKAAALTQGGVSEKGAESLNITNSDNVAKPANTVISGSSKQQQKKKKPKK